MGKGNLIFRDLVKHTYTFIDRRYNRAIRLVQRPEPVIQQIDPVASVLREKVMGGRQRMMRAGNFSNDRLQ